MLGRVVGVLAMVGVAAGCGPMVEQNQYVTTIETEAGPVSVVCARLDPTGPVPADPGKPGRGDPHDDCPLTAPAGSEGVVVWVCR
jgi:hypothetical protein